MLLKIKVILGQGKPHYDGDILIIHTTEKPEKGMANRDIIRQVAALYHVSSGDVHIKSGLKSRKKVFEITGEHLGTQNKKRQ